ncbi:MAG: hypothetical protein CL849_06155 [Crocinitomicaceae bacterium]|nr:hypothetical protein [Crocinitomicaceae bacterium]
MALTLVLDAGGSRLKWSLVRGRRIETCHTVPWAEARAEFVEWTNSKRDGKSHEPLILGLLDRPSTPAAAASGFPNWLDEIQNVECIQLDPTTSCPFAIEYKEGHPGADRLAAAVACAQRDPGGSFVIVDAGTCITVDLLSPGRWRGGAILPGLFLQSASLARAGLPVLQKQNNGWPHKKGSQGALGRTTMEAIEAGIPWATRQAVTATAAALIEIDPCAQVIITGGDAAHFDGMGGWRTFADPNLVLSGMAQLLKAKTA